MSALKVMNIENESIIAVEGRGWVIMASYLPPEVFAGYVAGAPRGVRDWLEARGFVHIGANGEVSAGDLPAATGEPAKDLPRTARVTLACAVCGYMARRPVVDFSGSHGLRELPSEPARCIHGRGWMDRVDGRDTLDPRYWEKVLI